MGTGVIVLQTIVITCKVNQKYISFMKYESRIPVFTVYLTWSIICTGSLIQYVRQLPFVSSWPFYYINDKIFFSISLLIPVPITSNNVWCYCQGKIIIFFVCQGNFWPTLFYLIKNWSQLLIKLCLGVRWRRILC